LPRILLASHFMSWVQTVHFFREIKPIGHVLGSALLLASTLDTVSAKPCPWAHFPALLPELAAKQIMLKL